MNSWVFYSILQGNLNDNDMEWIDVNDELPEEFSVTLYLVCLTNNMVTEAGHYGNNKWFKYGFGDVPDNNPVTHWMPKPNPPKRKKKSTTI